MSSPNEGSFTGRFEIHTTVETQDPGEFLERLGPTGLKPVMVQLEGDPENPHPIHLMTATWHTGTLAGAKREALKEDLTLRKMGLIPIRTKIEAALATKGIPRTNEHAKAFPKNYFESHFLFPVRDEADHAALTSLCTERGIALSGILRGPRGLDQGVRYASFRHYHTGFLYAAAGTKVLIRTLEDLGRYSQKNHSEYVVYDSNPDMDRGWAQPGTGA